MKPNMKKFVEGTILMSLVFIASCATAPSPQVSSGRLVDVGKFSVKAPDGEGWNIQIDKQNAAVIFVKAKQSAISKLAGVIDASTLVRVFRNEVVQPKPPMSEEETADEFRNFEEKIMIEEGVNKGQYKLEDVKKGTTIVNGRKLYFLSYKTTAGTLFGGVSPKGPLRAAEAVLYLYFPEHFKETNSFYCFLISETYTRPAVFSIDLGQIIPIIRSFKELENKE